MFTKLTVNKVILNHVLSPIKHDLMFNHNYLNYCSLNRLMFTSIDSRNEINLNKSGLQSMDLNRRKMMTKLIRKSLPISSNVRMDWNQLKHHLKCNFDLNNNHFKQIVIPIVSHSERTHSNTLISLDNYLRPTLSEERDPLLLTYHFLLINKIIEKCSHFSDNDNIKLSEKLLTQILFSSTDQLESGVITRIIVIIRDSLLSLANSSVFNCGFALNLWTLVLKTIEGEHKWRYFILKPELITSRLFELSIEKSLRSEAIELAKLSHQLIDFRFSDSNIQIWLQTLLRINSNEENIKFFQTLKITDSKIDTKNIPKAQLLLDRMGYDCKLKRGDEYFGII